jgi:hypothetical protein
MLVAYQGWRAKKTGRTALPAARPIREKAKVKA